MLSIAVDNASSIIWNVNPFPSTMKSNAEFIGRPTTLRCFILVFKEVHTSFAILLQMTERKVHKQAASISPYLKAILISERED